MFVPMPKSILNEPMLLERLSLGDEKAFAAIYKAYWQVLYDYACQRLHDAEQAKDVVQEVFISLWDNKEVRSIENLKAYLQSAIRYRIYNLAIRGKVQESYFSQLRRLELVGNWADSDIQFRELSEKYELLLLQMPHRQQHIFKLRYEEGLSTKRIAEELHISQKTVQNQLHRTVNYLKAILSSLFLFLF